MAISKSLLSCDSIAKTSSKRSARRIAGVAALAFLVAATLGSSIVLAGNSVGSFEIDGNLAPDYATPPAEPIDWLSNPFPASLTTFHDVTGQGDNIFGMGSKENDQSGWVCTTGRAPQKAEGKPNIAPHRAHAANGNARSGPLFCSKKAGFARGAVR